jgi:hypothetical protein
METTVVYELFNFITSLIRKIYEGIVDCVKWIVKQFRPSTHYKAMLEHRRDNILRELALVNEKSWEESEMYIEKYTVMRDKLDAITLIIGLSKTLLNDYRYLQDDSGFKLIASMEPHLKVLGYKVEKETKKVLREDDQPGVDHKKLKELGWSLLKVKDSIGDVIRVSETTQLFKDIEQALSKLKRDTKTIEKNMAKLNNQKLPVESTDLNRINVINRYVVFFATLGKALSGVIQNIAFKYINLCDKMKNVSSSKSK